MQRVFLVILLAGVIAGCRTETRRVDPADDDVIMGTGLESGDVLAIGNLAESLMGLEQLTGPGVEGVPTVTIYPVRNDTDVDFDAELLVRTIRQKCVDRASGRVRFVTRDDVDQALIESERQAKRSGEYTSSKQEVKTGADFWLTGTASSVSKVGRGLESRAIFLDFRLVDAENGELLWEKRYTTKKVGEKGIVYR